MKKINFNSGDSNSYNDGVRLKIAMDPDSVSTLIIGNNNGSGYLTYLTESDYIYSLERISFFKKTLRDVKSEYSDNAYYSTGVSWLPGSRASSFSSSKLINEDLRVPGASYWSGDYLITGTGDSIQPVFNKYINGNILFLEDVFGSGWSGSNLYEISDVYSEDGVMPFIDIERNSSGVGVFNIYSSDYAGSVFTIEVRGDISTDPDNDIRGEIETRRLYPIYTGLTSELNLINEWNSIFDINDNSNADSTFDTGEIRDEVYVKEITRYINKNWEGSMKDYLWKDAIENIGSQLTTDQSVKLKKVILLQLTRYGASDDIKKMVEYHNQESRLPASMRWHIGLGGKTKIGLNERSIKREYTFVSALNKALEIYKVYGLPLREAFAENIKSNKKLSVDTGTSYFESPRAVNGYYPLYKSRSMAEQRGDGNSEIYELNNTIYYMPKGLVENVTFFLGNYDPKILLYNNVIDEVEDEVINQTQNQSQETQGY